MKRYQLYSRYQDENPTSLGPEESFDDLLTAANRANELSKNAICYGSVKIADNINSIWITTTRVASTSGNPYKQLADELGVPLVPPIEPPRRPYETNPTIAICGQCGLHLKQCMHYVCGQPNCPTGLGGSRCTF